MTTSLCDGADRGDHASRGDVARIFALSDRQSADDLTQETYLRALPALARFEGASSARTWLLSIARNTCADDIRRRDGNDKGKLGPFTLGPPRPQQQGGGQIAARHVPRAPPPPASSGLA